MTFPLPGPTPIPMTDFTIKFDGTYWLADLNTPDAEVWTKQHIKAVTLFWPVQLAFEEEQIDHFTAQVVEAGLTVGV